VPSRPPVTIRMCREGDLAEVLEIERESFEDPYDREKFLQLLWLEPEGFIVAETNADMVGYVASSAKHGIIFSLAVSGQARRKGVGSTLMEAALKYMRETSETVSLQVRVSNSVAIHLYENFGFTRQGTVKRYYRDGEDALVMFLNFRSE